MIITKTPFRMSFFGGGTDMESFFKENGGAVLSTTFDKYCYVNVRHLPRFFDYSTELSYSKTERVTNIDDIQHPAIRNAMKQNRKFPEKVIKYLWDDAFKFNREIVFETTTYQSLEQVIRVFMYAEKINRFSMFKENVRNAFIRDEQ